MNKYLRAALQFGLTAGILCIVAFWIMYFMGMEPISLSLIFGYIITPLFIFLAIKNFRDRFNGGNLFFSQGMTVGFFVYTIMALISAVFIFTFLTADQFIFENFKAINLEMLENRKDYLIEQLNRESFDATYISISNMTIWDVVFNDFLRKIIPGLFFTIIITIILKRNIN